MRMVGEDDGRVGSRAANCTAWACGSFKERIYLDKTDKNILHNELTVYDHALTRPWSITRDLRRNPNSRPEWKEFNCAQNNPYVAVGKETYFLSADSLLMPMRRGQPAPDLRYFK
jgi:hypothetical protein